MYFLFLQKTKIPKEHCKKRTNLLLNVKLTLNPNYFCLNQRNIKHFYTEAKHAIHLVNVFALLELEKEILKKIYVNFVIRNMANLVKCLNQVEMTQLIYNNQQRQEGISQVSDSKIDVGLSYCGMNYPMELPFLSAKNTGSL